MDLNLLKKCDFSDILGQEETKQQLKSALLVARHLLIIGPPGIGKTTLAKNVAALLPELKVNDCSFHCLPDNASCPECVASKSHRTMTLKGIDRFIRIQGSPDLTVEDLIGDIDPAKALKFGPMSIEAFTPGKIFKANHGILFFDEINRCPEKLQNALLQVLEEGKATLGSYTVDLPAGFIFIATMNPEDSTATEMLSDVFLDRFDSIEMGYPETLDIEARIVRVKGKKLDVGFPEPLLRFGIAFVRLLRESKELEKKPSVRASLGLYERAQSNALILGKKHADIEDIRAVIVSVLSRRISLKPSIRYLQTAEAFISEHFNSFADSADLDSFKGGCP